MKLLIILFSFAFCLLPVVSIAQDDEDEKDSKFCNEIENKKAIKLYEEGTNKKKTPKKGDRIIALTKCLELEPDFAEANWAMAKEIIVHCKLDNKPFSPAVPYLQQAIASCPKIHSEPYYYIGFHFYEETKNDSAIRYLKKFIDFKDDDDKKFAKDYEAEIYQAKEMIKYAKKETELKKKIVPFSPTVVKGVSTPKDEYLAFISPDDQLCFFTRKLPVINKNQVYTTDKEVEVFMVSKKITPMCLVQANQCLTHSTKVEIIKEVVQLPLITNVCILR